MAQVSYACFALSRSPDPKLNVTMVFRHKYRITPFCNHIIHDAVFIKLH